MVFFFAGLLPAIGSRRVNQLTDQDLQEIINTAYAAGRSRKVLKLLAADLRAFCKYCRKARLSAYVPEELKIPAGARYKGKTILQPSDLVKLFNVDTTTYRGQTVEDEYINAYRFQVLTGLRPGEVIGLDWADIHGSMINVSRSVNVEGEQTRGKNENAVRSFQLSALACHVLDEQREAAGGLGSVFRITNEQHYYKRWRTYCAANGLTPCSLYELRHTFVSVVKTLPAGEVKSLVGHSADMDTFGVYAHTLTGDAAHTAQAVNGVSGVKVGGDNLAMIAGPCSVESYEQVLEIARAAKASGANLLRGGAFKPRTSPYSFQGLGLEGLDILTAVKEETGLPIVTELMSDKYLDVFNEKVDLIQIGARNMQNFDLLKELGQLDRPILLKRGLNATYEEWIMSAEYIMASGNENVILCERGIRTFESYTRNTLDLQSIPVLRKLTHLPIIVDPSHAGGKWWLVDSMAMAAIAAGADGLMIEVHNDPESALCDGAQSLKPKKYDELLKQVAQIANVVGKAI